jgi:hypothetical protein
MIGLSRLESTGDAIDFAAVAETRYARGGRASVDDRL